MKESAILKALEQSEAMEDEVRAAVKKLPAWEPASSR